MSRRGRRRLKPLPPRDGVDATRLVVRPSTEPVSVRESLLAAPALAGVTADDLARQWDAGLIVDVNGEPVDLAVTVLRPVPVYLYRELPDELPIPFEYDILHLDDDLVAIDKPHFLATMPRGQHVVQTALVRLRRQLGNDDVAPAHRLDRLTAGILLFTLRPEVRSAYQDLFAHRLAHKEYRAIAPLPTGALRDDLLGGLRVSNRIVKDSGDLRARVVDGEINAVSEIFLESETDDGLGVYRLHPLTGRTHQLRLHLAGLGLPIVGDPLYPEVDVDLAAAPERGDFSRPLRLVATRLEFTDPISGARRSFSSTRGLVE